MRNASSAFSCCPISVSSLKSAQTHRCARNSSLRNRPARPYPQKHGRTLCRSRLPPLVRSGCRGSQPRSLASAQPARHLRNSSTRSSRARHRGTPQSHRPRDPRRTPQSSLCGARNTHSYARRSPGMEIRRKRPPARAPQRAPTEHRRQNRPTRHGQAGHLQVVC